MWRRSFCREGGCSENSIASAEIYFKNQKARLNPFFLKLLSESAQIQTAVHQSLLPTRPKWWESLLSIEWSSLKQHVLNASYLFPLGSLEMDIETFDETVASTCLLTESFWKSHWHLQLFVYKKTLNDPFSFTSTVHIYFAWEGALKFTWWRGT